MNITIIGAGAFGSALGHIMEASQNSVTYYNPESPFTIVDAQANAELILLAVPSKVLPNVIPDLRKDLPLVVATKGILNTELFNDFADWMVLSGPGFACDIEKHYKTALTSTDLRINQLLANSSIVFDNTDDKKGVLLCGSLKNIYAIYAGLKNYHPDTKKHQKYIEETTQEMKAILLANSANPKTVDLSCGVGDLILTCNYPSRNYEFGQKLIENEFYQPEKTVEGVSALKEVKRGQIIIPNTAFTLKELIEISDNWA